MIWADCNGAASIRPIKGLLYRLIENQEQVATLGYVDTLEEQAVLEALLEASKPDYPDTYPNTLHYLLKTPFRYPPLRWGSRFGRIHEPSLFYGGKSLEVTLAESAFYRFVFLRSMEGNAPAAKLNTEHTLFTVGYKTLKGIQLQQPPFNEFTAALRHRTEYALTQALGTDMREAGVEAFEYLSARSARDELCVALFTPAAFTDQAPQSRDNWFCELTQEQVTFKAMGSQQTFCFSLEEFTVNGQFPMPVPSA